MFVSLYPYDGIEKLVHGNKITFRSPQQPCALQSYASEPKWIMRQQKLLVYLLVMVSWLTFRSWCGIDDWMHYNPAPLSFKEGSLRNDETMI